MILATLHPDEARRIEALRTFEPTDAIAREGLTSLTCAAAVMFGVPTAFISMIDATAQRFPASVGLSLTHSSRAESFCSHTILHDTPLVVTDARRDPRFEGNPFVLAEPPIVFYAGIPLRPDPNAPPIGSFCVVDKEPRTPSPAQLTALRALADAAEAQLRFHHASRRATPSPADRESLHRLLRRERQLNAILSASPNGIFTANAAGHLRYTNAVFRRITGFGTDAAHDWREVLGVSLQTDPPVSPVEVTISGPQGPRVLELHLAAVDDDVGGGFVGVTIDLTAERKTQQELAASRQRLLEAQTLANVGHWSYNIAEDRFQGSEQLYRIHGIDPASGSCSGGVILQQLAPDDFARLLTEARASIPEGRLFDVELPLTLPDGTRRVVHSRGHVGLDDGTPTHLHGTTQDITEAAAAREGLEAARAQAETSARAQARFLATMSHELRTPVSSISGVLDLLRDTPLTPPQQELIHIARGASDALLGVVNDILDLSKLDAGKLELHLAPFCPLAIVEDTATMLAERAQRKGLEIYVTQPPDLPGRLLGDSRRLQQIVINLCSNAVRFTDAGEVELRVDAETRGDHCTLRIAVRDTGVGMSPQDVARLFTAYEQVGDDAERRAGGTGLGLTICKRLADAMAGRIEVASTPGSGSTLTLVLTLPCAPATPDPDPAPLFGQRVLVIDPHPGTRASLRAMLTAMGAEVRATDATSPLPERRGEPQPTLRIHRVDPLPDALQRSPWLDNIPCIGTSAIATHPHLDTSLCRAILMRPVRRAALLSAARGHHPPRSLSAHATEPPPLAGFRVLLAEDHPAIRQVITTMLQKLGALVEAVPNGQRALDHLATHRVDVVLMDCRMPILDGFEATHRLLQQPGPHPPIIALTANALPGDREVCLEAGMSDYLAKPVSIGALQDAVLRQLRRSPRSTPQD